VYSSDVNALGLMQVEDYYETKKARGQAEMMAMPKRQKHKPLGERIKKPIWLRSCRFGFAISVPQGWNVIIPTGRMGLFNCLNIASLERLYIAINYSYN
jgi:hypothetical protein